MDERHGETAVTGVAQGSLGTGTALEDTQEWVVPQELRVAPPPEPAPAPSPSARTTATAAPPEPTSASAAAFESAQASGAVATRRTAPRRGFASSPRAAGLAAVVLLALIGVTAMVTSQDRPGDDAGSAPAQVTAAPTDAPAVNPDGGNGGKGDGNGKDKDKDKPGNGNANGH